MSRLAELEAELLGIELGEQLTKPTKPLSVSFVSAVSGEYSEIIAGGMERLTGAPVPRSARGWADGWQRIVDDAQWLVREGWADQALILGWEPLHLFSIAPDDESDARPGLAVWLNSSRNLVLINDGAISREGNLRRVFNVRDPGDAILLWDLK